MNINFSVSQFNRATRANGETIIEVSNDDISPCIVTIIADQRTNSPLIVLSNINDANLRRVIFDAIDQATPNYRRAIFRSLNLPKK